MKEIRPVLSQRRIFSGSLHGTPLAAFHRDRRNRADLKVKRAYWNVGVQVNKQTGRWWSWWMSSDMKIEPGRLCTTDRSDKTLQTNLHPNDTFYILFCFSAVLQHIWLSAKRWLRFNSTMQFRFVFGDLLTPCWSKATWLVSQSKASATI